MDDFIYPSKRLSAFAVTIAAVNLYTLGLISVKRSTVLKLNIAAVFSFAVYVVGVQFFVVDFEAQPLNYLLVALPLVVIPLAGNGNGAELSLVTPVAETASKLIQTLVLDSSSVVVQTRGEAIQRRRKFLRRPDAPAGARSRASSGMFFGRIQTSSPPLLSPLRLMWCIMATATFLFLRQANLLDAKVSTLLVWVVCTIVVLIIEQQLHIKSRFVGAAVKGRQRVVRAYEKRYRWQKRDAPVVDSSLVPSNKTPLLAFVNTKSGGGVGQVLIRELRALGMHDCQIWQLSSNHPPRNAFEPWLSYLKSGRSLRLLVAGGDGTVSWVLGKDGVDCLPESIQKSQLPVAILPLGTGNDLAKSFRWNSSYSPHDHGIVPHLLRVVEANERLLDRWTVTATTSSTPRHGTDGADKKNKQLAEVNQPDTESMSMLNYCGIGCGARVALNFHTLREQHRWLFCSQVTFVTLSVASTSALAYPAFKSDVVVNDCFGALQLLNKFIYANIGGGQVLRSQFCFGSRNSFARRVEIICDGKRLEGLEDLHLEGVIVLNMYDGV